jgi:hypothetical protein
MVHVCKAAVDARRIPCPIDVGHSLSPRRVAVFTRWRRLVKVDSAA